MKKILLYLLLLLPLFAVSQANNNKKNIKEKIFFGGGVGLGFGTYTSIEVSPMIGYKPVDNLYLGTKLTYQYYSGSYTLAGKSYDYSTSIYGSSLFGTYILLDKIVGYAEYEFLNVDKGMYYPSESGRLWLASPILGGGLSQKIGPRSRLLILLLWNFNESKYVPYSNPMLRVSFMF